MQEQFYIALKQLSQNQLPLDQVVDMIEQYKLQNRQYAQVLLGILDNFFANEELSTDIYFKLKTTIKERARTTRVGANELESTQSSTATQSNTAGDQPMNQPAATIMPEQVAAPPLTTQSTSPPPTPTATMGVQEQEASEELRVGSIIKERFVLEQKLGRGGTGTVFKALDLRKQEARDRDPYVALKVLSEDLKENPMALTMMQREAKRSQSLAHPNIINVYDFDRDKSNLYMTMEYLDGNALSDYIEKSPQGVPFEDAWPVIKQMASALECAHNQRIVHSDFKPSNILLDASKHIKVLDFGIACAFKPKEGTRQETTLFNARRDLGALTPAYASLDMFERMEADPRDDIYGLACITYEILSGTHPFNRLPADQAYAFKLKPKVIPGLDRKQWKGLLRGLAFKREERTPSVAEFLNDIRKTSSMPLIIGGVVAAVIVIALGIYFYIASSSTKPAATPSGTIEKKTDSPATSSAAPPAATMASAAPAQNSGQANVGKLVEQARQALATGQITSVDEDNALKFARQALALQPGNPQSLQVIQDIIRRRVERAQFSLDMDDINMARMYQQQALQLTQEYHLSNTEVLQLAQQIDSKRERLSTQVN